MIFYFSGTGNSKYLAGEIASQTGDTAVEIMTAIKLSKGYKAKDGETIGFVFPVYAWRAPEVVDYFARSVELAKDNFVFAVCNCGSEAGKTLERFQKIIPLDAGYTFVMPSNYIIGADVLNEGETKALLEQAKIKVDRISKEIINREKTMDCLWGIMAAIKSSIAGWGFNKFARSTKPFAVSDDCNSCGLCAKICPARTIKMVEGKPKWDKGCFQCLGCINRCPKEAICYGSKTQARGKYYIEKYI
ncbi:MAG: EFR1 family ferrodoxin [Anaerovoracaceae bacterium]